VKIMAEAPIAVDTRTGDQTFSEDKSHAAPTTTSSQVIQEAVAGAVRAPTGEVHIRGQHAEYTYYVDGVPVPSGVSGSLNELFDPAIVNSINFRTGGWDAEFGGKNAAVIDVATRIPTGAFHLNAAAFGGSFNTMGQSLSASGNSGKWGFFGSFSQQSTDMRREPVSFDTVTFKPYNFHNHGQDLYGFGKVQYTPSPSDVINLEGNWSRTTFQVPFDSSGGVAQDDNQADVNAFLNLGWRHRFTVETGATGQETRGGELFAGAFYRYGSLRYTPGLQDDPQFIFYPDTNTPYNLRENRDFTTTGLKLDYSYRSSEAFEVKTGVLALVTTGHESFVTTTRSGAFGPASNSGLSGNEVGVYAQTAWSPSEHFELRTGVRWDEHTAPFAGTVSQVSPRVRLNFFIDPANTLYLYYAKLFVPTNVEDLRAITTVAQAGVAMSPTLPERDNFYEAAYIHRFPVGVVTKLSAYFKESSPGIDDNTVPGSSIVTEVNIARVRITGVEAVLEVRPNGPLSGNVNVALNHAYGTGPITGGFFPTATPVGFFDLDHDQRLSINAGAVYSLGAFFLSATEIYGSGLTNGVDPADCGCAYGTGLLDFNSGIKVQPNYITNLSAGYTFLFGTTTVRPELFVDNVFDNRYLLKGTFFSGASVGRPRSMQFRVNLGI
jgi:outer membrane cobalamin receptor